MNTIGRIVLLLLAILLLGNPWPDFCGNAKATQLNEQFLKAARRGNFEEMKKLLNKDANVNAQVRYQETALFFATLRGNGNAVQFLLSKGANVNAKNDVNETALVVAAQNKNVEIAKILLSHRADVNSKRYDGSTPLMIASRNADLEMIQLLLSSGANTNVTDNTGRTALDYTAFLDVPFPPARQRGATGTGITTRGVTRAPASQEQRARMEKIRALLREHGGRPGKSQH